MASIESITAREILDSRGYPTVETTVVLDDGSSGVSSVPTGESTGSYEAVVLLDNDENRYHGRGVLQAMTNINVLLANKLQGHDATDQKGIDRLMIELDGTENKNWLGANAILPVSQAVCVAAAKSQGLPLYKYLRQLLRQYNDTISPDEYRIPTPQILLIEGGVHGAGNLDFQEFMIAPPHARNFPHALRMGTEIYYTVKDVLKENEHAYSVGIEGGYTPNLYTNMEAFSILTQAIEKTPYHPGQEVFFCLDVAASTFEFEGRYTIKDQPNPMKAEELINYYEKIVLKFHLLSLEDPLGENEWKHWSALTERLGTMVTVIGDDLLVSNPTRLRRAIAEHACNAVLIKPNQVGTVSETLETAAIARDAQFRTIVSHRGGETTDSFIADLAVAIDAQYVKFGAPARGERVVKYNRLLKIYSEISDSQ